MSHVSIIYGCIQELWVGSIPEAEKRNSLIRENTRRVLSELPVDEEWPPLLRQMFAVSDGPASMTFSGRTIHFSASMKGLDIFIREWMDKFEDTLKKLHWSNAFLHFQGMAIGDQDFSWSVAQEWFNKACDLNAPLAPIESWEFASTLPLDDLEQMTGKENRNNRHFMKRT